MKERFFLVIYLMFAAVAVEAQTKNETVLSIDSVFALAAHNSTRLQLSQAAIETAQQGIEVAENRHLLSVDVGVSALYIGDATILDRNLSNSLTAAMPHFGNNFSLEASYLVFSGGAVSKSIEKARLDEQLAQLAHKKDIADMRFLVAGFYLDLYKLSNQRKVFLKNIEQTQVLISQIRAKQNEGMALANDLTRYELMLQNLELSLIEIDNHTEIINRNLVIALGLPTDTHIVPDTSIHNLKIPTSSEAELMQIAEANRPELGIAKLNSDVSETRVHLARSAYYPSVALVAADNFNGPIMVEVPPINKNLNYWYAGVGVKYNLASLYKTGKEVRLAQSAAIAAKLSQRMESEQMQTAVFEAQTKLAESYKKLQTYQKSFQLAVENYAVINNRYINELVLISEMLDASNTKLNAELQVVNANLNTIYCHFKLQRELGTL